MRLPLALALVAMSLAARGSGAPVPAAKAGALTSAQSNYIEYCSGCHGIQGRSRPTPLPELRDRVGYFMCTPQGREYLVRLPNVAHAPIPDDADLAALMNFVVFGLGGASVPKGSRPFEADEVGSLRRTPFVAGAALVAMRRRIVTDLIRRCGAPRELINDYSRQAPA
ncbi:MAG: cytochrome C [Rhizobium sp.]|nr:MAG: cytochrome C [Rhizobium sp.]